jgi:hypothetical protein
MIVLYTANLGISDTLKQAPAADRAVCFVDVSTPEVPALGWELVHPPMPSDMKDMEPRLAARWLRCHPHLLFPDADATIWCDASQSFHDYRQFLDDAAPHALAGCRHPNRTTAWQEGEEVVRLGQATRERMDRLFDEMRRAGFNPTQLTASGLLYRTNCQQTKSFNEAWWWLIQDYGLSDQVTIEYAAFLTRVPLDHLRGTYAQSPYVHYHIADHRERRRPYVDRLAR